MSESSGTTTSARSSRSVFASHSLRAIGFVVPTVTGSLAALLVFRMGRPFDGPTDYVLQLVLAVVVALVVSGLTSFLLARFGPFARLRERSSDFDVELHSRFSKSLRAGNTKTMLRTGPAELTPDEQMQQILTLLDRLRDHDRLTRGHSERVRAYSTLIGEELELADSRLQTLSWCALLHDVGKLDVSADTLSSPTKPTANEWTEIRTHPSNSRPYLEPLESWLGDEVYHAAEGHHEKWDGTGYPAGIAGTDIPLFGRIVCVADAFDVMTSSRSYKKPFTIDDARERLADCAGTQFDPTIVAAFLRIGEPRLRAIRSFAAVAAGASTAGLSGLIATGAQVLVAATTVVGTALVTEPIPHSDPPDSVAFEDSTTTTIGSTVAPTTSTIEPPTTPVPTSTPTSTSPTSTAVSTTVDDITVRVVSMEYSIGSIQQDGQAATVNGDRLDVFVDGTFDRTIALNGRRSVQIAFDVTDYAPGLHSVRFDLYDGTELVSSDVGRLLV